MSDSASRATSLPASLRPFYADWAGYNRRTIDGLRGLTADDLALTVPSKRDDGSTDWPIWAIAGHTAATRVFWLCDVFGEPGAELTPFEGETPGWEDDLSHARSAEELVGAWETTWKVIEGCLDRWTPESLRESARREDAGRPPQIHTRQSILMRMINHEAYHLGEINVALGANGREPINPWPPEDWREDAAVELREG